MISSSPKYFTPLRYPGGKGKLTAYIKEAIKRNHLLDGEYAEPYAGGAGIALELLFHEYVSHIHINDLSKPIYAFWNSVLSNPEPLSKLICDTPLTLKSWTKQKQIFARHESHNELELGFATFFLNRTNRSGILNGGVIGGRSQKGPWKIDARYNREELVRRVVAIARMKRRISLTSMDAIEFLKKQSRYWPSKTLIYLDPPYFAKGRDLYYDFYQPEDHEQVERFITNNFNQRHWIVSYDNVPTIRALYKNYKQTVYRIGYSAREVRQGSEIMFFSHSLEMPRLIGPFKLIRSFPARNGKLPPIGKWSNDSCNLPPRRKNDHS